jgi:DNA-binding beta-propeller fold protein YncE
MWYVLYIDRIQVLSCEGHLLASFGSNGSGDNELSTPSYIALDEQRGYLYVCDEGNERIQVLHQSALEAGGLALHHSLPRLANCAAICPLTGHLWCVSTSDATVTVINPTDGTKIRQVNTTIKGEGDATSLPYGIALLQQGNVTRAYVADSLNCRITVFE